MKDPFWNRLRFLLKTHKISQQKFAEYINIPVGTFWSWIYRDLLPDAKTACAMAESLGVTVEYLVRGTDDVNVKERMYRTMERKSATIEIKKLAFKIGKEAKRLR